MIDRPDGKYCFRNNHAETKEAITAPKTPEAIAAEKEWKAKHESDGQTTKYANAVETFKQMGKDEVEKKLNTTNTHLNQIELKVSKLLSEGTTPKDALATVKLQEEALRVKKAQLNKALGAFVTHVTRYDLGDDGLGFVEQEVNSPVGPSAGSDTDLHNAYIFYSVLKRQLHLISQYKGGMTLKR